MNVDERAISINTTLIRQLSLIVSFLSITYTHTTIFKREHSIDYEGVRSLARLLYGHILNNSQLLT